MLPVRRALVDGPCDAGVVADRPTAKVTFLFTDVEGSTRFWEDSALLVPDLFDLADRFSVTLGDRAFDERVFAGAVMDLGRPFTMPDAKYNSPVPNSKPWSRPA